MTEPKPIEVTNLDIYGHDVLPWSRPRDLLADPPGVQKSYLGTVRPDGRPHSAGVYAPWVDGDIYFVSGPGTRKSQNLTANPACTLSYNLVTMDLILEGEATRVTDKATLEKVAAHCREDDWPVEVEGNALTGPYSAQSAGHPPWYLYRFAFHTAFGVANADPDGATRWRFSR